VHVTGFLRRGLRLQLVAALSIALAVPALALAAENAPRLPTQTALAVHSFNQNGHTRATLNVTVTGEDGRPATGVVVISDSGTQAAGAALDTTGKATLVVSLPEGDHSLTAAYTGDATHLESTSDAAGTQATGGTTPNFGITVSPVSLSLTPGQTGTVTASVTPENSAALTSPMFVTLSCSGLPDQASCTFTPENIEILPGATAAIPIPMVVVTQAAGGTAASLRRSNPVAWAFLLPGALALGGLAWSARRRPWLNRLALLALVAFVTLLGTTACAPRYDYYNHGPPIPPATPAGNYNVIVTAQSSNGVTAITNNANLALTVQ
jgi:hypothetical protein